MKEEQTNSALLIIYSLVICPGLMQRSCLQPSHNTAAPFLRDSCTRMIR